MHPQGSIFCINLSFCRGPLSLVPAPSVERKAMGMHNTSLTSIRRKRLENHSYSSRGRIPDLPVHSSLGPVCHGSMLSSQRSLLLPEHWSPLPASYCLSFPTPIKVSQLAGLETGEVWKESGRDRGFREEGASHSHSCSSAFCQIGLKPGG